MIAFYFDTCAKNGTTIMQYFYDSISTPKMKCGNDQYVTCDAVVIWSKLWAHQHRKQIYDHYTDIGIPIIILEVGALLRNVTWKLSINHINNNGLWGNVASSIPINVKPWRKTGNHILLCGQNERSGEWTNGGMDDYINDTISTIQKYTARPITVRPHPRSPIKNKNVSPPKFIGNVDSYDFPDALINAWAVVSFNSNPGIESVINGIPVFCDESSLASSIGNLDLSNIENPVMPDRTEWIKFIKCTEFYTDEIKTGLAWNAIAKYVYD